MADLTTLYDIALNDIERAEEECVRLGDLLDLTVNVMRGTPPPDAAWSTHDVAELAAMYRNVYVAAIAFIAVGGWQGERNTPQFKAFDTLVKQTIVISDNLQRDYQIIRDALAEQKLAR